MDEQTLDYVKELQQAFESEKLERMKYQNMAGQASMFNNSQDQNLIQYQLELDNILERVEHLLRGDELKFDSRGNITWEKPKDTSKSIFNEYGVQEIMRILSLYLNRNTILSNYDEETINVKVFDFGNEIADLIYMKSEEMGLDNAEKRKLYSIIVRQLVDTVHSTYLRALGGGERQSLHEARHVHQTQPLSNQPVYPSIGREKKFSLIKPWTWT